MKNTLLLLALILAALVMPTMAQPGGEGRAPELPGYMVRNGIAKACVELLIDASGKASIATSSGNDRIDRLAIEDFGDVRTPELSSTRTSTTPERQAGKRPITVDLSSSMPSGKIFCPAAVEQQSER